MELTDAIGDPLSTETIIQTIRRQRYRRLARTLGRVRRRTSDHYRPADHEGRTALEDDIEPLLLEAVRLGIVWESADEAGERWDASADPFVRDQLEDEDDDLADALEALYEHRDAYGRDEAAFGQLAIPEGAEKTLVACIHFGAAWRKEESVSAVAK